MSELVFYAVTNTITKFNLQKHFIGLPASEAQRPEGGTKAWQQEQPRAHIFSHKQETESTLGMV